MATIAGVLTTVNKEPISLETALNSDELALAALKELQISIPFAIQPNQPPRTVLNAVYPHFDADNAIYHPLKRYEADLEASGIGFEQVSDRGVVREIYQAVGLNPETGERQITKKGVARTLSPRCVILLLVSGKGEASDVCRRYFKMVHRRGVFRKLLDLVEKEAAPGKGSAKTRKSAKPTKSLPSSAPAPTKIASPATVKESGQPGQELSSSYFPLAKLNPTADVFTAFQVSRTPRKAVLVAYSPKDRQAVIKVLPDSVSEDTAAVLAIDLGIQTFPRAAAWKTSNQLIVRAWESRNRDDSGSSAWDLGSSVPLERIVDYAVEYVSPTDNRVADRLLQIAVDQSLEGHYSVEPDSNSPETKLGFKLIARDESGLENTSLFHPNSKSILPASPAPAAAGQASDRLTQEAVRLMHLLVEEHQKSLEPIAQKIHSLRQEMEEEIRTYDYIQTKIDALLLSIGLHTGEMPQTRELQATENPSPIAPDVY